MPMVDPNHIAVSRCKTTPTRREEYCTPRASIVLYDAHDSFEILSPDPETFAPLTCVPDADVDAAVFRDLSSSQIALSTSRSHTMLHRNAEGSSRSPLEPSNGNVYISKSAPRTSHIDVLHRSVSEDSVMVVVSADVVVKGSHESERSSVRHVESGNTQNCSYNSLRQKLKRRILAQGSQVFSSVPGHTTMFRSSKRTRSADQPMCEPSQGNVSLPETLEEAKWRYDVQSFFRRIDHRPLLEVETEEQ